MNTHGQTTRSYSTSRSYAASIGILVLMLAVSGGFIALVGLTIAVF